MKQNHHFVLSKIVATLGPASNSPEVITDLIRAGVDIFRVNFSHGDPEDHRETMRNIRRISDEIDILVGVLGDLSGPKIRCGTITDGPITPNQSEEIRLVMDDDYVGDHKKFGVSYTPMIHEVDVGHRISMNDGNVVLRVIGKMHHPAHGSQSI